jgi:hypothetical protein
MMKITESILIESDPFEPANLAEVMSKVADVIHQSEGISYTPVKSSVKTDEKLWKIAVLMRRPPATPDEWTLTVEAIEREAPF